MDATRNFRIFRLYAYPTPPQPTEVKLYILLRNRRPAPKKQLRENGCTYDPCLCCGFDLIFELQFWYNYRYLYIILMLILPPMICQCYHEFHAISLTFHCVGAFVWALQNFKFSAFFACVSHSYKSLHTQKIMKWAAESFYNRLSYLGNFKFCCRWSLS